MLIALLLKTTLHDKFFKRPQATKHPSKARQKFYLIQDFKFNKQGFLHFVLRYPNKYTKIFLKNDYEILPGWSFIAHFHLGTQNKM